ncbi:related to pisatin demethylase (cytochrome P450) [Fusarium torulosum]|uniref:Related to pisatin demethylase (Cytochrome P450) n=1 Tax=Fusarium torulosum TaxID=33205 RepID=A0AAE8M1H3_9HYPO|nr:related to pisatin demethylase (cytochrome P450) [Fusarium torulosum]
MGLLSEQSSTTLYLQAIFLIVFGQVALLVRRWNRLRHIPGPTGGGWSSWWQLRGALSGRYHEHLKNAADQFGPLIRIGPNELLSTDPVVLRSMSAVRSTYTKGDFYSSGRIIPNVDNVVSERDEAKHKAMRAKMAPGYSNKENDGFGFEAGIDRQLLNFIRLIDRKYLSTTSEFRSVDFAEKTQFFALDVIGDVSFGEPFGYLSKDEDLYNYNEINASSLPVMNIVSVYPWLGRIVHRWPLSMLLPREEDQVGFGRLMGFANQIVRSRLSDGAGRTKDMMQAHINSGMNEEELIQQVFISIIAGSNTSAHALRMIILSLITNPTAYAALITEIRQSASTFNTPISWAQTQTLPYLQAVVREGLRMWPPVAGLGFKQVPPEGDTINGFFVPGGTQVGQGFYAVGRSRLVWGEGADVFRPERWLLAEGDRLRDMIAAFDTHFGHGKYSCLGKPIALMEIHKAVFELIKRYDFAVLNAERPIKVQTSVFLFASDFWVKITRHKEEEK